MPPANSPESQPPDPLADRGSRAVLLAMLEGALDRGERAEADRLRRELEALGVVVRLGVVRPRGKRAKQSGGAS